MTDRLLREADPPSGQLASPKPQVWDPTANDAAGGYVPVYGLHNAPRAILYGPDGNPISNENPLEARVRELEDLIGALDASKETDPDAASAALLALVRGLLSTTGTVAGAVDNGALKTALTGSTVTIGGDAFPVSDGYVLRGEADDRPDAAAAHAVIPNCVYWSVDTGAVEVTDGATWGAV